MKKFYKKAPEWRKEKNKGKNLKGRNGMLPVLVFQIQNQETIQTKTTSKELKKGMDGSCPLHTPPYKNFTFLLYCSLWKCVSVFSSQETINIGKCWVHRERTKARLFSASQWEKSGPSVPFCSTVWPWQIREMGLWQYSWLLSTTSSCHFWKCRDKLFPVSVAMY